MDYDGPVPSDFHARLVAATVALRLRVVAVEIRKTRRGYHATVRCRGRIARYAVVAAQSILGSDWRREAFNMGRIRGVRSGSRNARDSWNVLYTRKITLPAHIFGG